MISFWHSTVQMTWNVYVKYSTPFIQIWNSSKKNIKKLPFLDVLITEASNKIETTVYEKPTFLGLYAKWDRYIPTKCKANLIKNLLHRAHQITFLHKEFNKISLALEKNDYPKNFLNKHINCFMGKHFGKDSPKNIFSRTLELKSFLCSYHLFAKFQYKWKKKLILFVPILNLKPNFH